MTSNLIDVHWCVNPRTGAGTPRTFAAAVCSNCRPLDVRCYEVTVPHSEVQSVINRMIEREKQNDAH